MRRFSLQWGLILACAVLLLALGIGLGGTRAAPSGQASTGQASAPNAPNALLYSQLDSPAITATDHVNSQDYENFLNTSDDQAADDFPIPAGVTWSITQVVFLGEASSAANQPASFNVYFYTSTGTLPGNTQIYTATAQTFTRNNATNTYTVTLTTPATLNGGATYWVSVQGVLNYGFNARQWFWRNRTVQSNSPAAWRNPGGGQPNVSCTVWTVKTACFPGTSPDQAFQLNGTSVAATATATRTGTATTVPTGTQTPTAVPTGTQTATAVPTGTQTATAVPPT